MKKLICFACTLLLILAACKNTEKKNSLAGSYLTVSYKYYSHDTLKWSFPEMETGSEMKIWSDKNFVFSGTYRKDTTTRDNYGGGTYTLDGDHYTENIQLHSDKSYIGTSIKMLIKINGDTLTQTWPVDENWNISKESHLEQKLVRADK